MPKILHNVEEVVYKAVLKLAQTHGYDKLNMKQIAQESGITVLVFFFTFKKLLKRNAHKARDKKETLEEPHTLGMK